MTASFLPTTRQTALVLSMVCAACLVACSTTEPEGDKIGYKTQADTKKTPLEVPPDLTKLAPSSRYSIPGGPVSANKMEEGKALLKGTATPNVVGDVSVERMGTMRWLKVKQPAEKVWPVLQTFWKDNGFVFTIENQEIGVLETEWAENRAKLPQDLFRRTVGKLFDSLFSTGERDKFRTRVEQVSPDVVEISVSHRGMVEVYTDASKSSTVWQPRPSDPALEDEFLRRIMVKLGTTQEQANASLGQPGNVVLANLIDANGAPIIAYKQGFDVTWRRLGVTLDRSGFTVEDRDRKQGLYYVRYVEQAADKAEPGFFGKLFGSKAPSGPVQYRLRIESEGDVSKISILNGSGEPDRTPAAQKIAKLLVEDLK